MKLEDRIYEIMNGKVEVCRRSHICEEQGELMIFRCDGHRFVAVRGAMAKKFDGRVFSGVKICLPDHGNRLVINEIFPWTIPTPLGGRCTSLGCGDCLGYANPAQLHSLTNTGVKPVLGQQSPEELSRTGRRMQDVVDTATWASVEEGYREGFGCDADGLSCLRDIRKALEDGCTMITVDYYRINAVDDKGRMDFLKSVQDEIRRKSIQATDLEISLDKADSPTSMSEHMRIAEMLLDKNIYITSLAPRWPKQDCTGEGEMEDSDVLRELVRQHADIAKRLGYRLSLHHESRRKDMLQILAEETDGIYHVKMKGIEWMAAVDCIYQHDAALFREMFQELAGDSSQENASAREEEQSYLFFDRTVSVLSAPGMRDAAQEFLRNHGRVYRDRVSEVYGDAIRSLT